MRTHVVILLALLTAGCDKTASQAVSHLRALGYSDVACEAGTRGIAKCTADQAIFRCAATDSMGCEVHSAVACEPFRVEKSSIEKPR